MRSLTTRDIEESFEDPFAVRLLPDSPRFSVQARFFNLGRSASGTGVVSLYRTNGKTFRVIFARPVYAGGTVLSSAEGQPDVGAVNAVAQPPGRAAGRIRARP